MNSIDCYIRGRDRGKDQTEESREMTHWISVSSNFQHRIVNSEVYVDKSSVFPFRQVLSLYTRLRVEDVSSLETFLHSFRPTSVLPLSRPRVLKQCSLRFLSLWMDEWPKLFHVTPNDLKLIYWFYNSLVICKRLVNLIWDLTVSDFPVIRNISSLLVKCLPFRLRILSHPKWISVCSWDITILVFLLAGPEDCRSDHETDVLVQ